MTVLNAAALKATHPMLPEGWRRSMTSIQNDGGPWACPAAACGGPSYLPWRCSRCGHNLADDGSTAGRQGATR